MTTDELNRQIAEKIMGWHLGKNNGWWGEENSVRFGWTGYEVESVLQDYDAEYWNPCVRWDHFGFVLERVYTLGEGFEIEIYSTMVRFFTVRGLRHGLSDSNEVGPLFNACAAILEAWK